MTCTYSTEDDEVSVRYEGPNTASTRPSIRAAP